MLVQDFYSPRHSFDLAAARVEKETKVWSRDLDEVLQLSWWAEFKHVPDVRRCWHVSSMQRGCQLDFPSARLNRQRALCPCALAVRATPARASSRPF